MTHSLAILIILISLLVVLLYYLIKLRSQKSALRNELAVFRENFELRVKERTSELEDMREKITEYAVKRFEVARELASRNKELESRIEAIENEANDLRDAYVEKSKLALLHKKTMRMVIHDLKNPLNIILHNATNTENPGSSLKRISQVASEMTNLVLNTLDIERFEESEPEVRSEHYDLVPLILHTCQKYSEICSQKSVELGTELPKECYVISNRNLTARILENLLGNACKFTPPFGKILITVTNLEKMVRIEMSDNGPGIRRQMVNRVFEEYVSDDSNAYAYTNSDGLGLTFCKYAVEAQEGKIGLISKEGEGTRIWFTLKKETFTGISEKTVFSHISEENELHLTEEDMSSLKKIISMLQGIEISEISTIIRILSNDLLKSNSRLRRWKENIETAAFSADKNLFDKLLRIE